VTADATRQIPTRTPGGLDVDLGELSGGPSTNPGPKPGRRKWLVLGMMGGAALSVLLGTQLVHKAPAPATAATASAAEPAAQLPAAPAAHEAPAAPAPKPTVEISFDSVPQDATVKRDDSGEVVGRTPLTITLPQSRDVVAFRVEKDGYAPTVYKVIPDLSKAVRVEMNAQPVAEAKPAPVTSSHRTPSSTHARSASAHGARPASGPESAPAAEGSRDCMLSIASFPWADLWIDGKDTGQRTPVVHYPVSCGGHRLALKRRDLKIERVEQVMVAPNHELKQSYELSDEYAE
jgi:hypothetical protein